METTHRHKTATNSYLFAREQRESTFLNSCPSHKSLNLRLSHSNQAPPVLIQLQQDKPRHKRVRSSEPVSRYDLLFMALTRRYPANGFPLSPLSLIHPFVACEPENHLHFHGSC